MTGINDICKWCKKLISAVENHDYCWMAFENGRQHALAQMTRYLESKKDA